MEIEYVFNLTSRLTPFIWSNIFSLAPEKVFILYQLAHMALYNRVALTHENKFHSRYSAKGCKKLEFRAIRHITGGTFGSEKEKMTFVQHMNTLHQLPHSWTSSM